MLDKKGENKMQINNMFNNYEELNCKSCGTDVLKDVKNSIVVFNEVNNKIISVYACCKGECDNTLGSPSGWRELYEFTNPYLHLKHTISVLNNLHDGLKFEDEAIEGYKDVILRTSPFVYRDMEGNEKESASMFNMLPF